MGVELVKRPRQGRRARVSGRAAGVAPVERQARGHEARVAVAQGARGLVPGAAVVEGDALAVAEDVAFLEAEAEEALAAFRARGEARVRGPAVLAAHDRVHQAVLALDRDDVDAAEGAVGAQVSFRLDDLQRIPDLAGREQELVADDRLAGRIVDLVGDAERPPILARDRRVEHVHPLDADLPDHRAGKLGRGLGRLPGAGGPREDQQREEAEPAARHARRSCERISVVE